MASDHVDQVVSQCMLRTPDAVLAALVSSLTFEIFYRFFIGQEDVLIVRVIVLWEVQTVRGYRYNQLS